MTAHDDRRPAWPELDYPAWRATATTLQLWTQIVGKVRLALTPWLNHGWHVPLYVTARGLGTSPMPRRRHRSRSSSISSRTGCVIRTSDGGERGRRARADAGRGVLRASCMAALRGARGRGRDRRDAERGRRLRSRSPRTTAHAAYDAEAAHAFWRALVQADRVFKLFRTGFLGKASPVHFFWGSFDLAVTRFSGRRAPLHPGGVPGLPDAVTREAYSHEVQQRRLLARQRRRVRTPRSIPTPIRSRRASATRRVAPAGARSSEGAGRIRPALRGGAQARRSRRGAAALSADDLRGRGRPRALGSRRSTARSARRASAAVTAGPRS